MEKYGINWHILAHSNKEEERSFSKLGNFLYEL